jgi:branched-chain amino acid transport system substrate-binding protein
MAMPERERVMSKHWFVALGCAVVLIGTAACTTESSSGGDGGSGSGSEGPMEFGFLIEQSGSQASVGAGFQRGTEAALEYWNSDSSNRRVELDTCDTLSTGEGGVNCYQQLKSSDLILGPDNFITYSGVAAIGANQSVPLLTAVPFANPAPDTSIYQTLPLVSSAVEFAFEYFTDHDFTKIATLTSNDAPGNAALDAAKNLAGSNGIELVTQQSFDPATQNLTPQASAITDSQPDAVLVWAVGPPVVLALEALRNAGVKAPVMMNYGSMSVQLLSQAGENIPETLLFFGSPAFAPDTIADTEWRQRVTEFNDIFQEKFDTSPDLLAYLGADAFLVAAQAASEDSSATAIHEALESGAEFEGLFFPAYSWSADDHVVTGEFQVLRWQPDSMSWVAAE